MFCTAALGGGGRKGGVVVVVVVAGPAVGGGRRMPPPCPIPHAPTLESAMAAVSVHPTAHPTLVTRGPVPVSISSLQVSQASNEDDPVAHW